MIITLLLIDFFLYGYTFSFNAIMNKFISERFGYTTINAGYLSAVPTFMCAFLSPIIAYFVDKYGKRPEWLIFSFVFGILS